MDRCVKKAFDEYNSENMMIRRGGKNGKSFWNVNSSQFMFVPSFSFHEIPGVSKYDFSATDKNGKVHTFTADVPTAPLTPIWKDIPAGVVELKIEGVSEANNITYVSGVRTFYKAPFFPGRSDLPQRACSYKECALRAFRYVFNDSVTRHFLEKGTPDPNYYHNVYPSKMIASIVKAMLAYRELERENADEALKLAVNAADYLLSITYGEDAATAGLPPTYSFKGLNKEIVDKTAPAADGRKDTIMMLYPASAGIMYLNLEKETGDEKYFNAAKKIADYYKSHVLPNGSWYLLISAQTGEPESDNCCSFFDILVFLNAFYARTKEECWHKLEENYFAYIKKKCLDEYKWEGQFEDIDLSGNYLNLTHFPADSMIEYIVNNLSDDEEMVEEAKEIMRFVEDQFVAWGEYAPWSKQYSNTAGKWFSPAGMEQYYWYVPIDSSTTTIMKAFLMLYSVTKDDLLLEKACALGDSVTRMQNTETGVIPTHWIKEDCMDNLENFWINCHIGSAFNMMLLAKTMGEI